MPRPRGAHGRDNSTSKAVRLPKDLYDAVLRACGSDANFAEWARNVFRRACRIPLDYEAGYQEGYKAGWAAANYKFREALKSRIAG